MTPALTSQIASGRVYAITPLPAGPGEDPLEQGAAPYRLAGDPDRLAAGPVAERGGVGVEGGQVDHGEGRLEVSGGAVQAVAQCGAFDDHDSTLAPRRTMRNSLIYLWH